MKAYSCSLIYDFAMVVKLHTIVNELKKNYNIDIVNGFI